MNTEDSGSTPAIERRKEISTKLRAVLKKLPTDYEPYGERPDDERGPDCSTGCRYFIPLQGKLGADWGICMNPKSPRAGLLTWEHQGCKEWADEDDGGFCHDCLGTGESQHAYGEDCRFCKGDGRDHEWQ